MLFLIYLLTCSAPVLSFLFILKQWLVVKFKFYHLYDFCACANKRISSCSITSRCHFMMFMLFSNKTFSKSDLISFENHSQQHFDLVLWLWRSQKLWKHNIWSLIIFENKVSKTSFVLDQRGVTQPQMSSASDIMMYTLNIETLIFLWKSENILL